MTTIRITHTDGIEEFEDDEFENITQYIHKGKKYVRVRYSEDEYDTLEGGQIVEVHSEE